MVLFGVRLVRLGFVLEPTREELKENQWTPREEPVENKRRTRKNPVKNKRRTIVELEEN